MEYGFKVSLHWIYLQNSFCKFVFLKTQCQTVSQFRVDLGNSFCTWVSCRQQFLILKTYVGNSFQYAGSMQEKVSLCIWTLTQKHIKALQFANSFPNLGLFQQIASGLHRQRDQGTSQYIYIFFEDFIYKYYIMNISICKSRGRQGGTQC